MRRRSSGAVCGALPVRLLVPPLSLYLRCDAVLRCGVDVRLFLLSRSNVWSAISKVDRSSTPCIPTPSTLSFHASQPTPSTSPNRLHSGSVFDRAFSVNTFNRSGVVHKDSPIDLAHPRRIGWSGSGHHGCSKRCTHYAPNSTNPYIDELGPQHCI